MRRNLWRASLRHLTHHPWQLVLAVLGVGLGVAIMVAIDVASGSASRAFELSSAALSGKATHSIEGGVSGLPDELYRQLRIERNMRPIAPIVESFVTPEGRPERTLRLLGVDPFAEIEFERYLGRSVRDELDLGEFLSRSGAALLTRDTAEELAVEAGQVFEIDVGGRAVALSLMGFLQPGDALSREALADLIVVDVATAQEALGLGSRLTRIDLQLADDAEQPSRLGDIRALLPPDVELVTAESRNATAAQLTRAFRLNLQALSLLGLLCGAFLIYNTMTFAVVQRRQILATLRAIGTTRAQILGLILGEALLVGLVGVLIGELAGWAIGKGLVRLVTRTINDLYFVLNVRQVTLEPWTLFKGALLGLGTTVAATLPPSWEASSTAPRLAMTRSELESRAHRALPVTSLTGVGLTIVGLVLLLVPAARLLPAFAGLFAVLLGLALVSPLLTMGLMRLLTPLAGRLAGQLGRVATRGVVSTLSRTGIAVAALMVALSVTVGVDLMIRSFRSTVSSWLEYTLPADFYISVFTSQARRYSAAGSTLDLEAVDRLQALPQVDGSNLLRHFTARIEETRVPAIAIDLDTRARGVFRLKEGDAADLWEPFDAGRAVIISEPLAYHTGLRVGDTVQLATPAESITLPVGGVYYDYSSEQGVLFVDRDLYRRHWLDEAVTAVSLHASPGTDLARLKDEVRRSLGPASRVQVVSNHELRQRSLEVFDRTFLVTSVLRILAVAVAFIGVLSALMALQLERTRELGVLRACGLTPGQVWRLVTQQTGLMGLSAGLLSLPVGVVMAAIMTLIINRRSFGWSLELHITPLTLAQALLVAIVAALLAGCYPAWRMARTSPAESLREE